MVKINKIYTRSGDDGSTGLVGGRRVAKDCARVEAYGAIDELNAQLGQGRTLAQEYCSSQQKFLPVLEYLTTIQNELFDVGCELATPPGKSWEGMRCVGAAETLRLENWIDAITEQLPELRSFTLPGGSALNSSLHIARTVCRRAERRVLTLRAHEPVSDNLLTYLNRLSDFLFALSRQVLSIEGVPEYLWEPGKTLGATASKSSE